MEWSSGDGDGDDDDPNEVQLDDGDDGYDLPSPGRNFPSRLLPAGELFSLASFRPVEAAELSMDNVLCLRVTGVEVRERGLAPVDQGHHTTCSHAGGGSAPPGGVGPTGPTWVPPFGSPRHMG